MRLAPLSLVISLSLFTWQAHGQDTNTVSSIQAEIDVKQSEFKELSIIRVNWLSRAEAYLLLLFMQDKSSGDVDRKNIS